MTKFQRQIAFWLAAFAVALAFIFIFREILLPFVAGMVLAYILDPLADKLELMKFKRLTASLTILAVFTILFILILVGLLPALGDQLSQLIRRLPALVENIQDLITSEKITIMPDVIAFETADLKNYMRGLTDEAASFLTKLVSSIWSGGQAIISVLSLIVVTPVVAFYLLNDWDRMTAKIDSWLPRDHATTIRELITEMEDMIAGFIRGQGLVCLILGVFYAVTLSIVGLNFGLLIGLGAGLIGFIPFIGSIAGLLVSVGVALAQFLPESNYLMIAVVAGVFFAGQFIEGNILQPRLVGTHVQLHPVWLMFSLFAFGSLFGFVGMLIAVPVAASIGVLVRFGLRNYLKSGLYLGEKEGSGT